MSNNDEMKINEEEIKKICNSPELLEDEIKKTVDLEMIEKYSSFLRLLANPIRMKILIILSNKDWACNCEFEAVLKIHQTLVSHHLRYLRNNGLIEYKKHGQWKLYKITKEARIFIEELLKIMEQTSIINAKSKISRK
ncbi:MAG TPA: metalloregulator ArsR/SmtB family transcription factor [candidate division Zixibacteria bacterium]|nr:metalloregulator ArsR/SmtB family transcription factor [candidate division Zixibacteria bacterium]